MLCGETMTGTPEYLMAMLAFWNMRMAWSTLSNSPLAASISTMAMFAPAQKFTPWLPITRPSQPLLAFSTDLMIMSREMGPMEFILEWNSSKRILSPMSQRVASVVAMTGLWLARWRARLKPRTFNSWRPPGEPALG